MRSVYIVGPAYGIDHMFKKENWKVTDSFQEADLIQFTGGEDVSPDYYGQMPHPQTHFNAARDEREAMIFHIARANWKPMAGICRGGQLLNVLCGGTMWQHVDNHSCVDSHNALDIETKEEFAATSTHHQMMKPHVTAQIIVTAQESTHREICGNVSCAPIAMEIKTPDIEALFYEKNKAFCFQPHPEYGGYKELRARYISYLEKYLFNQKEAA